MTAILMGALLGINVYVYVDNPNPFSAAVAAFIALSGIIGAVDRNGAR